MASKSPAPHETDSRGTQPSDVGTTDDSPVLLYDAKCDICNELAYKVRSYADDGIELVALSDPKAERVLEPFYSDDWSHDFYFVEDGTCRKGVRALPRIARYVGMKDFASLVRDYAAFRNNQQSECANEAHDDGASLSRRGFSKAMSAAALPLAGPLSDVSVANEDRPLHKRPPEGLEVHVGTVRPDGRGGFDIDIERDQSLVRSSAWDDDATQDKEMPAEMNAVGEETLVDTTPSQPIETTQVASSRDADKTGFDGTDAVKVKKAEIDVVPNQPDSGLREAIRLSGAEGAETGRMTRYGLLYDRARYGVSFNFARGPMVLDGEPTVGESMSGKIAHDVAQPIVDLLRFESTEERDVETHVDAYVAGVRAFAEFYARRNNDRMANLYEDIAAGLEEGGKKLAAAIEGSDTPIQNSLGITSVPNWEQYVASPSVQADDAIQTEEVTGTGCSCPGCCTVSCCTDCGCGCSVCLGTEPGCGCGCCVIGCGGGCGCGCCICA